MAELAPARLRDRLLRRQDDRGRRDLFPALLAAVAAVVYVVHGFGAVLSRDLGIYAYAGVTVADGVPPYVGIFNRAGPLAHLLPAVGVLGARLGGVDEVLGMRVFFFVLAVASVPVGYWLARDLFGSRLAGVAAATALAAYPAVTAYATGGPREKTPLVLFMLLALWALVHRRWFLSGVLVALSTLVLQIALIPLVPPVVAAAYALPGAGRRLRALAAVGAGGAASLAVTVACFTLVGRLHDFLEGFLLVNVRYTRGRSAASRLPQVWDALQNGYGVLLPVFLGSLLLLPLVALLLVRSRDHRGEPRPALVVGVAAGAALGVVWTLRDFDGWPDTYTVLPFSALGIAAGVWLLREWSNARVVLATTVVWIVLALVIGATYPTPGGSGGLAMQRRSVAAALSVLPGAGITSVEAPSMLVLAGQRNPSRHQTISSGLNRYIDDTWSGGFRGFTRFVRSRPNELVAVRPKLAPDWARRLAPRYERVGRAPDVVWFVDTGLDVQVREELRRALRVALRPVRRDAPES